MVCISSIVVLFEGKLLSWKSVLGHRDLAFDLANKYFFGIDESDERISIEQNKFYSSLNDEELWKQADNWVHRWGFHPKVEKFYKE